MDWDLAFKHFLADRRALGRSESTLVYYERCWSLFRRFWDGRRPIDRLLLREYLAYLGETSKPVTVGTWWRGLRVFLRWVAYEELVELDPTAKVKAPRAETARKESLTEDEVARLFAAATNARDRALVAMAFDTGLRSRELRELTSTDVDLVERRVTVKRGKNGKPRVVPLSLEAARAVRRWAHERDEGAAWFFYSLQHGREGNKLTQNGLYQIISGLGKRAGLRVGPHLMRHSMSRSFVAQGGSVAALQRLLGHSSLAVTDRYVNLNFDDLAAQHEPRSPFAAAMRAGRNRGK